jgi:hypothetical protein
VGEEGYLIPHLLEQLQLVASLFGQGHRIAPRETGGAVTVSILRHRAKEAFPGEIRERVGSDEAGDREG